VIVSCTCALGQHTAKRGVVGRGHGGVRGDTPDMQDAVGF